MKGLYLTAIGLAAAAAVLSTVFVYGPANNAENVDIKETIVVKDDGLGNGLLVEIDETIALQDASDNDGTGSGAGAEQVSWRYDSIGGIWQASGSPPPCPANLIDRTPVDIGLATSILYPGQVRGDDYRPHGGFRFDNSESHEITVRMPEDAFLVRGSGYLEQGEIQYVFDMIHPCGIMYRFDHLATLPSKIQAVADKFRTPSEGDSRTTDVDPLRLQSGEVIATAVGLGKTGNVFLDWGVYDLRQKNKASSDPEWAWGDGEFVSYAICWIEILPPDDREVAISLPGGDLKSGKQSDYCE